MIRMSSEEIREYLTRSRTIILTSIGRAGMPHPMPMFYAVEDDGAIIMSTYTKSQKIQNLKRDPRVALLVEDGAKYAELRGIVYYGSAELIADTDEVMRILAAVASHQGEPGDASADALAGRRRLAAKRTGIRVRPERTVSWDHRKLIGGG
jgi:PPOX class probable F420-dependent enzyme